MWVCGPPRASQPSGRVRSRPSRAPAAVLVYGRVTVGRDRTRSQRREHRLAVDRATLAPRQRGRQDQSAPCCSSLASATAVPLSAIEQTAGVGALLGEHRQVGVSPGRACNPDRATRCAAVGFRTRLNGCPHSSARPPDARASLGWRLTALSRHRSRLGGDKPGLRTGGIGLPPWRQIGSSPDERCGRARGGP